VAVHRTRLEPGNGTMYDLIHERMPDGRVFVAWLFNSGSGGGCAVVGDGLHPSYLAEKLSWHNEADCVAITVFLRDTYWLEVMLPPGYDPKTGCWSGIFERL
jgi:hypothetical protein